MKEKKLIIVPQVWVVLHFSFLLATWFISGYWLGPYLASWLPWLQTLVGFRCPAEAELTAPPTPSVTSLSRSLTHPGSIRHLSIAWKPLLEWYSSASLPAWLFLHCLKRDWPLWDVRIARWQTFCIVPTSHWLQSVQPAKSSKAIPQYTMKSSKKSTMKSSKKSSKKSSINYSKEYNVSSNSHWMHQLSQLHKINAMHLLHYTSNALFPSPMSHFTGKKNARLRGVSAQMIRGHNISTPFVWAQCISPICMRQNKLSQARFFTWQHEQWQW